MFTQYSIKLVNDHIFVDNGQNIIVDTGSPLSFHDSGHIDIGGYLVNVPQSLQNVTSSYLSESIGCEVHGLLGMDIIERHPILVSLKDGFMFFDDDDNYDNKFRSVQSHKLGVLIGVEIMINGMAAKMIVDSGAKISYINSSFTNGQNSHRTADDYSPFIGQFQTPLFYCKTDLSVYNAKPYIQEYGTPPPILAMLFNNLNVDGILGVEIFKHIRVQIRGNGMYFLPQGI